MNTEAEETGALLQSVADFILGREDDISVGVGRIIWPMSVCSDCGEVEDHSQKSWCSCWSPISTSDVEKLSEWGVEERDDI